jgi:hypothetical protein
MISMSMSEGSGTGQDTRWEKARVCNRRNRARRERFFEGLGLLWHETGHHR